jgi:hypothetical protein
MSARSTGAPRDHGPHEDGDPPPASDTLRVRHLPAGSGRVANLHGEPLAASEEGSLVRRRDDRHPIHLTALAYCHGRFQTVRVVDFSLGGLQLQGTFGVGPGDEMVVELLSGHRLEAKTAWSLGSRIGVRFLQPLTPEHPALAVLLRVARRSTTPRT